MKRRFFLTYLATAVLGGVLVFFGAPLARGFIPPTRLEGMKAACRSNAPFTGVLRSMLSGASTALPAEPEFDRPPGPQPRIRRPASTPDQGQMPVQRQQTQQGTVPEQPPTISQQQPPAQPVYDYSKMWAVVSAESAPVYDGNGNLAQELGVGSIVEIAAMKTTSADRLVVCRYNTQPSSMPLAIMRAKDLAVRDGSLESANPDLVELMRNQAKLEVEIKAMHAEENAQLAKNNPHAEAYNRATSACLTFNQNAKALRAKADKAQGSARVEIMDKLRSMKEEEAQLRREYEAARTTYDSWNRTHGGEAKDSEALKAKRTQLADIQQQIRNFGKK